MWWRWGFVGVLIGFLCAPLPNARADPGQIYACVQQGSNQVRIVSGPGQCRKPETPVTWSIQGPVGPAGPQGPKGETGPAGPLGVYAPAVVDVMCPTQSINNALQTVSGNPLTIQVHGTCTESITVTRNDVTLLAVDGGTLASPDPNLHAILIVGAQRVQVTGFTISAGGLEASDDASVILTDNTISGGAKDGIGVHILANSTATLVGNTVQNAAGVGVAVHFGSSAFLGYNSQGIGNTFTHNGADGLEVFANSTVAMQGTRITANAQLQSGTEGLGVLQASSVRSLGDNQITDNKAVGIFVKASVLRMGENSGAIPDQILRNVGGGIHVAENAAADLRALSITDNLGGNSNWTGYALAVSEGSRVRLSKATIAGGIWARFGSGVRFNTPLSTVDSMTCANNGYNTGTTGQPIGTTGQPSIAGSGSSIPAGLVGVNGCFQF